MHLTVSGSGPKVWLGIIGVTMWLIGFISLGV